MESTLSVFFGTDRTYVTLLAQGKKGAEITYINSIPSTVKDENDYLDVLMELESFLPPIAAGAKQLRMCIPAENALIHQFPAVSRANIDQIKSLLQLEIKQAYPLMTLDDFSTVAYPIATSTGGREMMIAIMLNKKYLMACEFVLGVTALPLERTVVSQFAAHASLLYNYPEQRENTAVIFAAQESFIDVSILKKGRLAYYNLIPLQRNANIGKVCSDEIEKILNGKIVSFVDGAFLLGPGLTKSGFESAVKALSIPVRRLNAFRMMTTSLSEREREYCIRTAHLYSPCIGTSLPDIHAGDEIRLD